MKHSICLKTLVASFALVSQGAMAEESGEILVTTEEETMTFALDTMQSDWSGSPNWASVSITGIPVDDDAQDRFRSFNLGFSVNNGNPDLAEATLLRIIDGEPQRLYGAADAEAGGLEITISDADADGDFFTVSGAYDGRLGPSDNFGRDIDLSQSIAVSGSFDVTLDLLR